MKPIAFLKESLNAFMKDDALTLGGALAFYSALSLAPLLLLFLWMASFWGESTQQNLLNQIVGVIGEQGGQAVKSIVDNTKKTPRLGNIAGIVSLGILIFSAAGVFAQLQHALNKIWGVAPKRSKRVRGWLKKRLLSVGMVLALGCLLIVSLVLSALLTTTISYFENTMAGSAGIWVTLNLIVPLLVFNFLFAVLFKYLPDVEIAWRDVWLGAGATSVLFVVGKSLIGIYLGEAGVGSAYGAAGSLVAFLVWIYCSALILLFGAELTQVWARTHGRQIEPDKHAVKTDSIEPIRK